VADGTSAKDVQALKTAAMKLGAALKVVAPKIGGAKAVEGTKIEADFQLAGGPSVLFDVVYVALSTEGAALLSKDSAAVSWVHDAFAHLKVIGAPSSSQALLDAAGVVTDKGVFIDAKAAAFLAGAAEGRVYEREPKVRTIY